LKKRQKREAQKRERAEARKIKQSPEDTLTSLKKQIRFIGKSSKAFDRGDVDEAVRIATSIRILLHDTNSSTSVLTQLGKKSLLFYDTALERKENDLTTYHGLTVPELAPDPVLGWVPLVAISDEEGAADLPSVKKPFDDWWNGIVLDNNKDVEFTREEIVLSACNKDGGAHVDPEIEERYAKVERSKDFAFVFSSGGKRRYPNAGAGLSTIRQVGFEVLLTLIDEYPSYFKGVYLYSKEVLKWRGTLFSFEFGPVEDESIEPEAEEE